jgi:hypothetical protein
MPGFISDSPLARDLIRIGNEAIAREDDAALRAYFTEDSSPAPMDRTSLCITPRLTATASAASRRTSTWSSR